MRDREPRLPLADLLRKTDLTYPEAGATAGLLPPGYHHPRRTVTIGYGTQTFTTAADALAGWQVHARAGLHVSASAAAAELGSVLQLSLGLAAIRIGAPARQDCFPWSFPARAMGAQNGPVSW